MAVFKNFENDELIISCNCGCDEGIHFKIADYKDGDYAFITFTNGNYYSDKNSFFDKLKKILAIIRNKDYYYSDIIMTKDDFKKFKEWVNKNAENNITNKDITKTISLYKDDFSDESWETICDTFDADKGGSFISFEVDENSISQDV